MTRSTSIETYQTIKANGLLSKRRWQVYDYVYNHGPATAVSVCRALESGGTGSITPRFVELKRFGVLKEVGEETDTLTGMTGILWDVTDKLPEKLKPEPTKNELINALCDQIEIMSGHLDRQSNIPEELRQWVELSKATVRKCSKYRKKKVNNTLFHNL
jgi:hypothetical protein